jgi:3-phosphoshikimate 1-carboxyvinyltransferase
MQKLIVTPAKKGLKGSLNIPGDKSISHRSIMFGSLARGKTVVHNFLNSEDCYCTAKAFQEMGVQIHGLGTDEVVIEGVGLHGLKEPSVILDMGNSGTSMRLMTGILSGQPFNSFMAGDKSLCSRPMSRIIIPLSQMGAEIHGRQNDKYPPLAVIGHPLKSIHYDSPVASAQVKSCLMLAGLFAEGVTSITEPSLSRDHTERIIRYMGGSIKTTPNGVSITPGQELSGKEIIVPGDISSAAFFMAAGILVSESELILQNVGINPTRTGILDALKMMNADITLLNKRGMDWEPVADIQIRPSEIKAAEFSGDIIPRIIDEIPILAVLATQAEGTTIIRDAKELRVKESDRIKTTAQSLRKMGAEITEMGDGMIIKGPVKLKCSIQESFGDHRIAMSMAVAGLIAQDKTEIMNTECINTSFPEFIRLMDNAGENIQVEN